MLLKLVTFVKEIGSNLTDDGKMARHSFRRKKTVKQKLFLGIWLLNKIFFLRSSDLFRPLKKSFQKNRLKKLLKTGAFSKENGSVLAYFCWKAPKESQNGVKARHKLGEDTPDMALKSFSPLFAELIRRSSFDLADEIYLKRTSKNSFMGLRTWKNLVWYFRNVKRAGA